MNKIYKNFKDLPLEIRDIVEKELNTPEEQEEFVQYFSTTQYEINNMRSKAIHEMAKRVRMEFTKEQEKALFFGIGTKFNKPLRTSGMKEFIINKIKKNV